MLRRLMAGSMLSAMSGRFVSFALIAGLLLAGCGGSAGRDPAPSSAARSSGPPASSVARSAPPSPAAPTVPADVPTTGPNLRFAGEKPPVMPVAATQHTRAGAVAFAEFFIKTIDWGYATTNSAYMRHYFADSCTVCAGLAKGLEEQASNGNHFIGDRFTIQPASDVRSGGAHAAEYTAQLTFDVTSSELLDKQGQFIDGEPALTARTDVGARWAGSKWQVVAMKAIE